ncbi:S-adenosyl-L-methionine-dependent methyltransferase [Aulographum hederae CBS 113979]|uniref:S-adenosyl-L-methionine-dependent methyltransferase n=1 Tax=Aulographum hederae CBS 113979 TaxID=1176131 RepID=A0A6G1HI01_9PEZI|nr:S-adenosyl-L-methionine-dependent methyltransferase [Aulographum hederae CBS 113979]
MATETPTLVELAEQILAQAKEIESALPSSPTFVNDTISKLPSDLEKTRKSLIDTTETLNALLRGAGGPVGRIFDKCYTYPDELALHVIYHFRIPQAVPMDGQISFAELAAKVKVDETQLIRILRHGMSIHLFHEPTRGQVAHTADTALLVTDHTLFDLVGTLLEDLRPAGLAFPTAMEKWPGSQEADQTGWQVAYDTSMSMYDHICQYPERISRFSNHLTQIARFDPRASEHFASAYPWGDLPPGSTIVDIGGGNGQYSVAVAERYSHLNFIVQEKPGVSVEGAATLPAHLKDRIKFMDHDMFDSQPVKDADIYFMRHVFHNWSDKYCVEVLKKLIPALKPGAKVLACDLCIPDVGERAEVERREVTRIDLMMMSLYNARERDVEQVKDLFEAADDRLDFQKGYTLEGCMDKICEATWKG